MLKKILMSVSLSLTLNILHAQTDGSLKGLVIAGETGEPVEFFSIHIDGTSKGASTDEQGRKD